MGYLFRRVTASRLYTKEGKQARQSEAKDDPDLYFLPFLARMFEEPSKENNLFPVHCCQIAGAYDFSVIHHVLPVTRTLQYGALSIQNPLTDSFYLNMTLEE